MNLGCVSKHGVCSLTWQRWLSQALFCARGMLLAGAVLALQGGAMSSVLKNLEAVQNFLGGMRSLSSYGPLEETQAAVHREGTDDGACPSGGHRSCLGCVPLDRCVCGALQVCAGREDGGCSEVSHGVDPPGLCCVPAHMAEMGGMGAGALSGRRPAERPTWT